MYSMSYGEAGQGLALYSLASIFDQIWLSPLGTVSINGLQIEQPYMRGLLNRLGIEPQFLQREEYKGVFENFSSKEMSDFSRESLQQLTDSLVKGFLADIIESRPQLTAKHDLAKLVNKGIFLDTEAVQNGLIDKVAYGDVLLKEMRDHIGGSGKNKEPELVSLARYQNTFKVVEPKQDDIAVIYIQGPIMVLNEGQEGNSIIGNTAEGADSIANLIVRASEDDLIKAIVLRVDSPGGSPTASELIRRAIVRAKENGKPVIVSMGSMAASGGYWVSAPADYIYALPGTITGSIGVAGGKVSLKEFWNHIDVNWDHVGIGKNAGLYSMNEPFSKSERELMENSMDRIYNMFLDIVAEGRDMTRESAREVAKGRVWSGKDALSQGLVDEMGGLNHALDYAAKAAGYRSRNDMNIITLPKPKTALEEILELLQKTAGLPMFLQNQVTLMNMLNTKETNKLMQDMKVLQSGDNVFIYEPMSEFR